MASSHADLIEQGAKPAPLLPPSKIHDRPLFIVLAILAFLATLTLLSVGASNVSAQKWSQALASEVTVQIKVGANGNAQQQAVTAQNILAQTTGLENIEVLSEEAARTMLSSWIGDAPLPDDLPVPVMVFAQKTNGTNLDVPALTRSLSSAGLDAIVGDHHPWLSDMKKAAFLVQTLATLILILLIIAVIGASVYATRAGMASRRQLMEVLHQIGTPPHKTARLFSFRFAMTGGKAGFMGAVFALILLTLLIITGKSLSGFLGATWFAKIEFAHILTALTIPVFMALVCGFTAWRTVLRTLYKEIYP